MEPKACDNCKHWAKHLPTRNCNWGTCQLIERFQEGDKAYVMNKQEVTAERALHTREDFYCSEFSVRSVHVASKTVASTPVSGFNSVKEPAKPEQSKTGISLDGGKTVHPKFEDD